MALISGIWPPAVTSSSLSPSRRLGIRYTHPTPKATRRKDARTRPETLELPRVLGTARRSMEQPGDRISFMHRVTVGHAGLRRQLCPADREFLPRLNRASRLCAPAADRQLPSTNHSLHKPRPSKRAGPCCGEVPHPSSSGHQLLRSSPGQPRHRYPRPSAAGLWTGGTNDAQGGVRGAAGAAAGATAACRRPGR